MPTAWSVEGLLPYLTDAAQDALFARIDHLSAPGSHLAVGALGSHYDPTQFAALAAAHPEVNISGDVDFSALTYDSHNRLRPQRQHNDRVKGQIRKTRARRGRTSR
jgi:O-methyltransferase involved in polyketide biosynthesis